MRLSLRFIVPLLATLALLAYALAPVVDGAILQWFVRDLDLRARTIANAVQEPLRPLIDAGNRKRVVQYFERLTGDERLFAVGYCPDRGQALIATPTFPAAIKCDSLAQFEESTGKNLVLPSGALHVTVAPMVVDLATDSTPGALAGGTLVLVHDMSFVERRSNQARKYLFYIFTGLGLLISLITVIIAQLS